jgi:hypothetical protein
MHFYTTKKVSDFPVPTGWGRKNRKPFFTLYQ